MGEVPAEFCGYEWPKDCERFEYDDRLLIHEGDSHQQTTCVRKTLPDTNRCAWHAAPDETEHKSIETLRNARVPAGVRAETELSESLDGVVVTRMNLSDELELDGILLRGVNLSKTRLSNTSFSGSDVSFSNLSEAVLVGSNFSKTKVKCTDFTEADLRSTDFCEADLNRSDLSNTSLYNASLEQADLEGANLSKAEFEMCELSGTNFSGANLLEARFCNAYLSKTDLGGSDLSKANFSYATFVQTDLTNTKISNLTVNRGTTVDSLAEPEPLSLWPTFWKNRVDKKEIELNGWDQTACAYHDLKTEFHDNGLVDKARHLHINERRARRRETAVEEGWFSRQHLIQFAFGKFTGYGVGVWPLVKTMVVLFIISTSTYYAAEVTNPLTYSMITFATSPPRPTGSLPIWARFVANVETFVGTLLIVLLGFVLSNREQF